MQPTSSLRAQNSVTCENCSGKIHSWDMLGWPNNSAHLTLKYGAARVRCYRLASLQLWYSVWDSEHSLPIVPSHRGCQHPSCHALCVQSLMWISTAGLSITVEKLPATLGFRANHHTWWAAAFCVLAGLFGCLRRHAGTWPLALESDIPLVTLWQTGPGLSISWLVIGPVHLCLCKWIPEIIWCNLLPGTKKKDWGGGERN